MEFCADLLYIVSSLNQATRHLRCKNEFNHFHHIIATIRCISIVQIPFHLDLTAPQGRPNSAKKTARYISYLRQCDNNISQAYSSECTACLSSTASYYTSTCIQPFILSSDDYSNSLPTHIRKFYEGCDEQPTPKLGPQMHISLRQQGHNIAPISKPTGGPRFVPYSRIIGLHVMHISSSSTVMTSPSGKKCAVKSLRNSRRRRREHCVLVFRGLPVLSCNDQI